MQRFIAQQHVLFHRQDEVADHGIDLVLPALAVEGAVVADIGLQVMALQMRAQRVAEIVGGGRLAERADVVAAAFDGEQRRAADQAGIDLAAAVGEVARRQLRPLEHAVDGLDVEFLGQVEDGEILVVEGLDLLRFAGLAGGEMVVKLLMLRRGGAPCSWR